VRWQAQRDTALYRVCRNTKKIKSAAAVGALQIWPLAPSIDFSAACRSIFHAQIKLVIAQIKLVIAQIKLVIAQIKLSIAQIKLVIAQISFSIAQIKLSIAQIKL
jgi:hypothetical protein